MPRLQSQRGIPVDLKTIVRYFTLTDYEPFYNVLDIKNIF